MYFFNNKIANMSLNMIIITTYNFLYKYVQLHRQGRKPENVVNISSSPTP